MKPRDKHLQTAPVTCEQAQRRYLVVHEALAFKHSQCDPVVEADKLSPVGLSNKDVLKLCVCVVALHHA